jgi:hypothetical protein
MFISVFWGQLEKWKCQKEPQIPQNPGKVPKEYLKCCTLRKRLYYVSIPVGHAKNTSTNRAIYGNYGRSRKCQNEIDKELMELTKTSIMLYRRVEK